MAKIQYNTKKVRVNTPPTAEEIFSAVDANEIKASVNYLYDNGADGNYIQATPTEPQEESIKLKKAIEGKDDMILGLSADSLSMKGGMFNQVSWNGTLYPQYDEAYFSKSGIGFKTIDKDAETIIGSGYWDSVGFGFDGDGGHAYFNHRGVGASNSQGSYRNGLEGTYFGQNGNGNGYHGSTGMGSSNSSGGVHAAIGSISSLIYGVGNLYHTLESIGINANAGSVSLEKNKLSFYPAGQPTFDEGSIIPNNIGRYDLQTPESFLQKTGTTTLTLPADGGTIARIEDIPAQQDLSDYIKSTTQDEAPQSASINVDGTIVTKGKSQMTDDDALTALQAGVLTLVDGNTYTNLYGGNLLVNSPVGSVGLSAGGLQASSAAGSITFNAGVIASNTPDGRSFSLLGGVVNVARNGAERTIEIADNATGNYNIKFPDKDGQLATLADIPAQQDLSGYVKLQQMPNVAPQVGNIMVNGAIAISDGAGTEVSLSGQGFTSFSPDGLVLISPSTITIQNLDFMNPIGAGISSRGLNIFNGQKTMWLEPNANSASGQMTYTLPLTSGELALKTDIPAAVDVSGLAPIASPAFTGVPTAPMPPQLSNDNTVVTSKWIWDHDVLNNISKFGSQEQTGYLTLRNWLTFKKVTSWQNSTDAGNLSYSDTHRWVFMASSDSIKNVGFEILPSDTRTVIRMTLPVTGGTIARLEDLPNFANFAKVTEQNTFTQNNTFNGYSNFQGASFQGALAVNSGKRTTLGGGVDIFSDTSIYSGLGKVVITPAYMGTEQTHSITVPANSGTLALMSDLNPFLRIDDIPTYINVDGKTNKIENLTVGATQRAFEANINNGFRFGISNDQYMGDTNAGLNNYSVGVSSEKREAGYGNLERGKKLSLTHYSDGLIFNQYSAPKNNQLSIAFPDYNTTDNTGAHLYFPASVADGTLTVLSAVTNAPASATASGVKGEVIITGGYRYECTSNNVWVRSAIETAW